MLKLPSQYYIHSVYNSQFSVATMIKPQTAEYKNDYTGFIS